MLVTANDIRLYQTLLQYCQNLKLEIKLKGDYFELFNYHRCSFVTFYNIHDLANYLYGYEAGLSAYKVLKLKNKKPEKLKKFMKLD